MDHTRATVDRYRGHIATEREAAALYRGLAQLSRGTRKAAFLELAEIEDKHAAFWTEKIRELGGEPPAESDFRVSPRTATLLETARRYSADVVLPIIEQDERRGMNIYRDEPGAPESMIVDEEGHAEVIAKLIGTNAADQASEDESWHRNNKSGTLRAAIFGVNDGLVSNTALVMGFAGAAAAEGSSVTGGTVLLAGIAGLLAGAFSMGAGEFISMANQREAFQREIELERDEIEFMPEEEQRELELIYQAKGLGEEEAREVAKRVMSDKDIALDTMTREELGLDPDELGSPMGAAWSSFTAFAFGAIIVVIPYFFTEGTAALTIGISLAIAAMVIVGGFMARLNGRPMLPAIARQVGVGVLAAVITYVIGTLLGVNVS